MKNLKYPLTIIYGSIFFTGAVSAQTQTFSDEVICKAAIAHIMNQKTSIIKVSTSGKEVILKYKRPVDGKDFEYKCVVKKSEKRIIWAAKFDYGWGRWRDSPYDSVISYEIKNKNLIIDEEGHTKTFKASELES